MNQPIKPENSASHKNSSNAVSKRKLIPIRQWMELFKTCFFALVALVVLIAGTTAWYARNDKVSGSGMSVKSADPEIGLFIRMTEDNTKSHLSSVGTDWTGKLGLYPISTADCVHWYYVDRWELTERVDNDTKTISGTYTPASYAPSADIIDGLYTNGGKTRRAFFSASYNLYTNGDPLDVYLDPVNPITVTYEKTSKALDEAIRIALADGDNNLLFIYAPYEEEAFYAVADAGGTPTVFAQNDIKFGSDGLAEYQAAITNQTYAKGTTSLCTANSNESVNLIVYIWLEGTDAQAVIGTSDSDTSGLSVEVNFVGVNPETGTDAEASQP